MSENETEDRPGSAHTLPMVLGKAAPRPSLARTGTPAAFLSQLIAERHHLAIQRQRRRAPVGVALDAYRTGASAARLRMPQGYRRTVIA